MSASSLPQGIRRRHHTQRASAASYHDTPGGHNRHHHNRRPRHIARQHRNNIVRQAAPLHARDIFRDQPPSLHVDAVDNTAIHIPSPRQRRDAPLAHCHHNRQHPSGRDTTAICHLVGPSVQLLPSRYTHPATLAQGCGIRCRHLGRIGVIIGGALTVINTNTHLSTFNAFYTIAFPK